MNNWEVISRSCDIAIDREKFGYSVIKNIAARDYGQTGKSCIGVASRGLGPDICSANLPIPELEMMHSLIILPRPHPPITISYMLYPSVDYTLIERDAITGQIIYSISVKKNIWNNVTFTVLEENCVNYIALGGGSLQDTLLPIGSTIYLKNVMVTYGTEKIPYEYNSLLPESELEQIVPDEYWTDEENQVTDPSERIQRQVYIKTFCGTCPTADNRFNLDVVRSAHLVNGYIMSTIGDRQNPNTIVNNNMDYYWTYGVHTHITLYNIGKFYRGQYYKLTFKYTKP